MNEKTLKTYIYRRQQHAPVAEAVRITAVTVDSNDNGGNNNKKIKNIKILE